MIIPTGYAQAAVPFLHSGTSRKAYVTFGVHVTGGQPGPTVVADDIWDVWTTTFRTVTDDATFQGPIEVIQNIGGTELVGNGADSAAGGSPDSRPPAQVAVLFQKRTGLRGRKNRGRFYLPWAVTDASVDETGNISGSTVTDFQGVADDFLAGLVTAGLQMVVLHNGPGTPTPVIQLLCSAKVATQRRRLGR